MIKKSFFFLVFVMFLQLNISAQDGGGSLYSRYGVGTPFYSYSARGFALGAVGVSLSEKDYLSLYNPAGWKNLQMTYFETGAYFRGLQMEDKSSSSFFTNYKFSGVLFGFPVYRPLGISIVGGLTPYSVVKYNVSEPVSNPGIDDYVVTYSGDGGISKLFIGASLRLPFDISIGATFEYFNGRIDYRSKFDFPRFSDFQDASLRREYNYHGLGTTVGVISNNFAFLTLGLLDDWRIGATAQIIGDLNTDKLLIGKTNKGDTQYSVDLIKTFIPPRISLGSSIRIKRFTLLADYVFQPWTEFKLNGQNDAYLKDSHRVGAGFEFNPEKSNLKNLWEQIAFRGGLSYEQTLLNFEGTQIEEMSVSLGFSFPFQLTNTIDFGIKAGIRGTTDNNLVKEKFISAGFTLSLGELWFVRENK